MDWLQLLNELKTVKSKKGWSRKSWIEDLTVRAEVLLIEADENHLSINFEEIKNILDILLGHLRKFGDYSQIIYMDMRAARWAERVGLFDYAVELFTDAVKTALENDSPGNQIQAMEELGEVLRKSARFQQAEKCQEEAYKLAESNELSRLQAHALNNLGVIRVEQGRLSDGEDKFREALELLIADSDPQLEAHLLNNLGVIQSIRGNSEEAYTELTRALAIREQIHDQRGYAETCHNIGMVMNDLGRYKDSEGYLEKALNIAGNLGEGPLLSNIRLAKADLMLNLCLYEIAMRCALEALVPLRKMNDPLGISDALRIAGVSLLRLANHRKARDLLSEALKIAQTHNHVQGIAQICESLAELELSSGSTKKFQDFFESSKKAYQTLDNRDALERLKSLNSPPKKPQSVNNRS